MTNDFLPSNYEIPSTSNYMKLGDGENTFRVLSSAVVGFEYWNIDKKPVRLKNFPESMPVNIQLDKNDQPTKIKPFWAFVVWNYREKRVQILEITQKSIMTSIKAYADNAKWGTPKAYDLVITRTGSGLDTEYSTIAEPHTPTGMDIESVYANTPVDLNNLFKGEDPFTVNNSDGSLAPKF